MNGAYLILDLKAASIEFTAIRRQIRERSRKERNDRK